MRFSSQADLARGRRGQNRGDSICARGKNPLLRHLSGDAACGHRIARHVVGLAHANSTEFDPATPYPVVALITEWCDRAGAVEKRSAHSNLGGTMRLGAQRAPVKAGTRAARMYGA